MENLRLWITGSGGTLTTEENGFRLTVRSAEREGGAVWFLVLRRVGTEFSIAAGGTEENIHAAMKAASFMAGLLPLKLDSVPQQARHMPPQDGVHAFSRQQWQSEISVLARDNR